MRWRLATLGALLAALPLAARAQTAAPSSTGGNSPALPGPEARPTLELSASLGPTAVFGEPANPGFTESFSRLGALLTAAAAYRSSYFVDPFLEVGYAALARGNAELPSGPWGEGGVLRQHLGTWVISPGVSADIWHFRPRFALGVAIVTQANDYRGLENSVSQFTLLSQLGLGFETFQTKRLRLDFDARLVLAPGADVSFASVGVVGHWDALSL